MSSRRSNDRRGALWPCAATSLLVLAGVAALSGPVSARAAQDASPRGQAPAPAAAAPAAPPVLRSYPARAVADYARAVQLAQGGNATEAELEFGQLAAAYPDLAGPQINIGLLRRRAGDLAGAETALRLAIERNPGSAIAWSELGLTLRMRGQFEAAAAAYERAIAADPAYAPAHRNLGVLLDLYLDRPAPALAAFERYRELAGEDKQLNGWIAELRQRVARLAPAEGDATAAPPPAPVAETTSPENAP